MPQTATPWRKTFFWNPIPTLSKGIPWSGFDPPAQSSNLGRLQFYSSNPESPPWSVLSSEFYSPHSTILFIGIQQHEDRQATKELVGYFPETSHLIHFESWNPIPEFSKIWLLTTLTRPRSFALVIPISLSVSTKWRGSLSKSSSGMLHMHLGLVNQTICKLQPKRSPDTKRNSIMCNWVYALLTTKYSLGCFHFIRNFSGVTTPIFFTSSTISLLGGVR